MVLAPFNSFVHTVRVCYVLEGQLQTLFFDGFNANSENVRCADPAGVSQFLDKLNQFCIFIFSQVDLISLVGFILPALFYFVAGSGFALLCY